MDSFKSWHHWKPQASCSQNMGNLQQISVAPSSRKICSGVNLWWCSVTPLWLILAVQSELYFTD